RLTRSMQARLQQPRERLGWLQRRLASPQRLLEQRAQQLDELDARMARHMQQQLHASGTHLKQLQKRLAARDPRQQLALAQQRLAPLLPRTLKDNQRRLALLGQRLHVASPLATLERGYSITLADGVAVRSVSQLEEGMQLETRLHDGRIQTQVLAINAASDN